MTELSFAWPGTTGKADGVRFFRKSPAPGPAPHRVHHPWNPPEAELPGIAPIDTLHFDRSERAAVAIIGIAAYARGFEFFLARRIRPGTPGLDADPTPEMRRRRLGEPEDFPISLRFSDGRKAISGGPRGDSEPTGPILQSRGGGGHLALSVLAVVGVAAAPGRAARVHLPVAGVRDRRNAGRHRRTSDPRCRPPKRPAMARR